MKDKTDEIKATFPLKPYEGEQLPSPHLKYEDFEPEEETHLRDYLNIILRRKWVIIIFFVSIVLTVTISSFVMRPLYKATAVIKIDKENPNVLSFKDVEIVTPDEDYYETQYKILKSRNLARRVIEKLDLYNDPYFNPDSRPSAASMIFGSVKAALSSVFSTFGFPAGGGAEKPKEKKPDEDALNYFVDKFLGMSEIVPVHKSQLVQISFVSPNPALSQKAANAIAQNYIGFNIESRFDASQQASQFLEKQIDVLKAKLEDSEQKLNDYSTKNEMLFVDSGQDKQNIMSQSLSEISTALNTATTNRLQAEALYKQIRQSGKDNTVIVNNPLIQDLKKEYATVESEYFNNLKIYKPEFPKMKRLKAQMDAIKARIDHENRNIMLSVKSDYMASVRKEKYLASEFNTYKDRMLDFQKRGIQYQILKRDADANREVYNGLLQRLKQVSISSTQTATNIQVLDSAEYPNVPFKPNKAQNILLSVLFGLVGGVGLAFFLEYFDNTIKNTQEIENRLRLPTLGMIPHQKLTDPVKRPMIAHSKNRGPVAEAFRSIGTFIMLSSAQKPPKTILVTSPGEKEGKTTICINTAMAFSESLGNGLIIDADLRQPKLHHTFEVDNSIGLTTYLSGNMELEEGIVKKTAFNGLDIITSGPISPNPSELVVSRRMKDLLDSMSQTYEFIIIDSAPVMGMPDSIYLSSIVDGSVIVIKAGETSRHALMETKKIFKSINAKILGVILNGIRENDLKYNYYSNYYSSYFKEQQI